MLIEAARLANRGGPRVPRHDLDELFIDEGAVELVLEIVSPDHILERARAVGDELDFLAKGLCRGELSIRANLAARKIGILRSRGLEIRIAGDRFQRHPAKIITDVGRQPGIAQAQRPAIVVVDQIGIARRKQRNASVNRQRRIDDTVTIAAAGVENDGCRVEQLLVRRDMEIAADQLVPER